MPTESYGNFGLKFEYVTLASNADRAMKVLRSPLERCCYIGVRANMS